MGRSSMCTLMIVLLLLLPLTQGNAEDCIGDCEEGGFPTQVDQFIDKVEPIVTEGGTSKKFKSEVTKIPQNIVARMKKYSWKKGCPVPIDKLAYVKLSYWGYDSKHHTGELIVKADIVDEVVDAFKIMYENKFPIERMELIEKYKGSDDASMDANNTSAFNCRPITGQPGTFSPHSYGTAIDINPIYNPYVKKDKVLPPRGKKYADRTTSHKGMIKEGDAVHGAFKKHGWTWGGTQDWLSKRCNLDYQHLQKEPAVPRECN